MGLIKAQSAPATLSPFSMKDIEGQARMILARGQQQADQILATAREEARRIHAQQKAIGFAEGRAEGLTRGQEEGHAAGLQQALEEHRSALTQLVTALNAAAQQIEQSRRQLEDNAAAELMKLAIAIAGRVAKRQGALDPNVLTENVLAAMKMVVHSTDLRIAVHPSQKQTLVDVLPRLTVEWPSFQHVEVVDDPSLLPGGCRIFTRQGLIDADLDEQLKRIAADLLPSAEAANPPPLNPSPGSPGEGRGEGSEVKREDVKT